MIFVTVGSTHFDPLIETIDNLILEKVISDNVICQIGNGKYEPRNCKFYRFL